MSNTLSREVTQALRSATGRAFCQYCRVDKPSDEFAWLKPRACCVKCRNRGTKRTRR